MTRIFENNTFGRRMNIYVGILVAVMIYGCWDVAAALTAGAGGDTSGLIFGPIFIGGGAYGLWQTLNDGRDLVAAFDIGPGGAAQVTLWRPFRRIVLDRRLEDFANWRFWVKAAQAGQRAYMIYVDLAGYPRKLQFELRRGQAVPDELRRIAPGAVADFEDATGARTDDTNTRPPEPAKS